MQGPVAVHRIERLARARVRVVEDRRARPRRLVVHRQPPAHPPRHRQRQVARERDFRLVHGPQRPSETAAERRHLDVEKHPISVKAEPAHLRRASLYQGIVRHNGTHAAAQIIDSKLHRALEQFHRARAAELRQAI